MQQNDNYSYPFCAADNLHILDLSIEMRQLTNEVIVIRTC